MTEDVPNKTPQKRKIWQKSKGGKSSRASNDVVSPSEPTESHNESANQEAVISEAGEESEESRRSPIQSVDPQQSAVTFSNKFSPDDSGVYARPRWRHASRVFGALIVVLLNISAVMTAVTSHSHGVKFNFKEVPIFLVVILCDLTILLPIICEVDMAKVTDECLILKTTFYNRAIPWGDITAFKSPTFMVFSYIKVGRCFYLINKRHTRAYDQLAQAISSRTGL